MPDVNPDRIRACIIGVGNCCTSLITGIVSYAKNKSLVGITYENIGGYLPDAVDFVLAFDVDKRKVGKKINEAILQKPNCTPLLCSEEDLKNSSIEFGMVHKGPVMDGVAPHMKAENEEGRQFFVDDEQPECSKEEIYQLLKDNRVDVIINYLPVGSEEATRFWAQACLDNKVNFLNCIPVFIASDPEWNQKFVDAELAIIGDDIQSQCGSSIVSSRLHSLLLERGFQVKVHSQINLGGNSDFENMSCKSRLTSKKISKENVIRNQNKVAGISDEDTFIYAGPSELLYHLNDTKVAHISIRANGYGGYPFELDLKMSVTDSPNSGGVVIDSVRFLRVFQKLKRYGYAEAPCVLYNKTPPNITKYDDARRECEEIAKIRFD